MIFIKIMIINQSIQKYIGFWVNFLFAIANILGNLVSPNQTLRLHFYINQSWVSNALFYTPIIYSISYLLLFSLQKRETNLFISKIHLTIIAICEILYRFIEFDVRILLFFTAISIIIFFTNIYVSLSSQNDKE